MSSDLSNLSILLRSSALLPKGLYLQNTIAVMKRELEDECDYIREAESGRRFHRLLKDYDYFKVPQVVDEASTSKV
ncbi:AarF/UbiB family protein, partial [Massilia sp. CT11-108]|uniref:AarF/UbiB family protein n=1 Tax=Massilia sp. CT11-108 TaxID=3393900 RepID=UPI0039A4D74B